MPADAGQHARTDVAADCPARKDPACAGVLGSLQTDCQRVAVGVAYVVCHVDQMAAVLKPGGIVHVWSDVEDYFRKIAALMDHHAQFEPLAAPPERAANHDMDYQTSFERKARQTGGTIHRGRWRRKP